VTRELEPSLSIGGWLFSMPWIALRALAILVDFGFSYDILLLLFFKILAIFGH
jgi:hypothetical protein